MAEYASKGVAGSGLGLGIAGTALGLLNNGGNGGVLGGLFGNNNQTAICPTPMAKYNSWTAPTNTPATGA